MFRTWTDKQEATLREMWTAGASVADINSRLGRPRDFDLSKKRKALGLPCRVTKFASKCSPRVALRDNRTIAQRTTGIQSTIISFMPESPRLEMEWRHLLAKVKAERGSQWHELLGATR